MRYYYMRAVPAFGFISLIKKIALKLVIINSDGNPIAHSFVGYLQAFP
jgi:hypothetical protein